MINRILTKVYKPFENKQGWDNCTFMCKGEPQPTPDTEDNLMSHVRHKL